MRLEARLVAAVLAAAAGAAPSPGLPSLAFTATLAFTPQAERRLERAGEGVVVDASW